MSTERSLPSRVPLGDLLKIKHGFAFKGEFFSDKPGAIVLTPGNFEASGGLKFQSGKDRSYTGPFPAEFNLTQGDLLVVMTDLTQEARILGAPATVPADVICLHNQRLGKVTDLDTDQIDKRYLYYLMNFSEFREQLKATATGSTVRHTSPSRIYEYRAPLVPLIEQRRIASILGAYDDLIEVNRRRIAVLEAMALDLFEEWFVRFRFPGHEPSEPDGTPNGLPKHWRFGKLEEIATNIGRSVSPLATPEDVFAHFSLPAYDAGGRPVLESGSGIMSNKLRFEAPAVLVSKLNPRIARVWHVPDSDCVPQVASTEFVPLAPRAGLSTALLYAYVGGSGFRERLAGMAGGTSTSHQRVKPSDILNTPIVVPPTDVAHKADELLQPLFRLSHDLLSANRTLAVARDLLLPRLISGELSVAAAERELEDAA